MSRRGLPFYNYDYIILNYFYLWEMRPKKPRKINGFRILTRYLFKAQVLPFHSSDVTFSKSCIRK